MTYLVFSIIFSVAISVFQVGLGAAVGKWRELNKAIVTIGALFLGILSFIFLYTKGSSIIDQGIQEQISQEFTTLGEKIDLQDENFQLVKKRLGIDPDATYLEVRNMVDEFEAIIQPELALVNKELKEILSVQDSHFQGIQFAITDQSADVLKTVTSLQTRLSMIEAQLQAPQYFASYIDKAFRDHQWSVADPEITDQFVKGLYWAASAKNASRSVRKTLYDYALNDLKEAKAMVTSLAEDEGNSKFRAEASIDLFIDIISNEL